LDKFLVLIVDDFDTDFEFVVPGENFYFFVRSFTRLEISMTVQGLSPDTFQSLNTVSLEQSLYKNTTTNSAAMNNF